MGKKVEISEEEKSIFRQAVRDVKELPAPRTFPAPPKPYALRKKILPHSEPTAAPYSDYEKVEPVSGDEMIEFTRCGLQDKSLRKLRRGQYNVEAKLDLHGMTAAEAKEALFRFLTHCQHDGTRHVLIIHGKGRNTLKPVLKNKLNNWLRQLDQILAFCSATAKDGQSGAMYVLLKNQQGERVR
jgi:DNA-nicking Smr family endonuclease